MPATVDTVMPDIRLIQYDYVLILPYEERVIAVRAEPREVACPSEPRLIEVRDDAADQ
jgi:hypothetical protein